MSAVRLARGESEDNASVGFPDAPIEVPVWQPTFPEGKIPHDQERKAIWVASRVTICHRHFELVHSPTLRGLLAELPPRRCKMAVGRLRGASNWRLRNWTLGSEITVHTVGCPAGPNWTRAGTARRDPLSSDFHQARGLSLHLRPA